MPMDQAWAALTSAYASIDIKLTEHDVTKHLLGNESFRVRRKVGDVQLGKALNCGGESSAPNAETYDITLSVRSQLTANTDGTLTLQTFVQGIGKNPLTNSATQMTCYSMGGFEKRIAELVKQSTTINVKKGN